MGHIRIINVETYFGVKKMTKTDAIELCHIANSSNFPSLNQAQITKLKYLTLASMAAQSRVRFCRSDYVKLLLTNLRFWPIVASSRISKSRPFENWRTS